MRTSPRSCLKIFGFSLLGGVVFATGLLSYAWFGVLKPMRENLERPRVPLLKKIVSAQNTFRSGDLDHDGLHKFGDLKALIKARLLSEREVAHAGFVVVEPSTSNPEKRWWAVAQPLHPMQGRTFFVNQDGMIYSQDTYGVVDRVNRKTASVPSGMRRASEPQ